MKKEFVLRYKDSTAAYMKFRPGPEGVYVHGPRTWASYIDKVMPLDESRKLWRDLVSEGYHRVDPASAPRDWWFRD